MDFEWEFSIRRTDQSPTGVEGELSRSFRKLVESYLEDVTPELLEKGVQQRGEVLSVNKHWMKVEGAGAPVKHRFDFVVRVKQPGHAHYDVKIRQLITETDLPLVPVQGQDVPLRIDPARPTRVAIDLAALAPE